MNNTSFVYIIHFGKLHSHAQHYVGSTASLHARLIAHARGTAARLTQVVAEAETDWVLGGLYQTTQDRARELEAKLKRTKHAPDYCTVCNGGHTPQLKPALAYPLKEIPFTATAAALNAFAQKDEVIKIHTPTDEIGKRLAVEYAVDGQGQEKVPLGFIPRNAYERAVELGELILAKEGGNNIGFLYYTANNTDEVHIHQMYVQDAHRMRENGRKMIDYLHATKPTSSYFANVREDLPANAFWDAVGYERLRSIRHATSRQLLNVYRKGIVKRCTQ